MEAKNDVNFIGTLALYQHRRDNALGLIHPTQQQRGLLWFYSTKQKELLLKAFHYGVIQGARKRIKEIKRSVKRTTPPEVANRLYVEAIALQKQIDKSSEIINNG